MKGRVYRLAASSALIVLCLLAVAGAQTGLASYDDRAAFTAASAALNVIDFDALAPSSGFTNYKAPQSLKTGGLDFRLSGGGRFGPGFISLAGAWYYAGPAYETGTGAKLIWAPPNQTGDAYLDVTLPAGVTAVGADLWTVQPYASAVEVTATTGDAKTRAVKVNTQTRPAAAFVGFTSDTPITSLRFAIPRGQVGLILDNFTFGRGTKNGSQSSLSTAARQHTEIKTEGAPPVKSAPPAAAPQAVKEGVAPTQTTRPGTSPAVPRAETAASQTRPAASPGRAIAYVRGGTEIRLIEADGTNDRRLWTHPDARKELGIRYVAWRPDGKELAFSSSHGAAVSLYDADLYAVRPDGTGLRKLTNAPDHSEFARYPKGTVTVTVSNDQPAYKQAQSSAGIFIVYVAGADEPQQITLPPGSAKTLVFKNVADFGRTAQAVVAIWGNYRWFTPGVDVQAGVNVKAPAFSITGDGIEYFGAYRPVWRADGSRVSYRSGTCTLNSVPTNPTPGVYVYNPLFGGQNPLGTCAWDWGPTTATANQLIYTENASGDSSVYRIAEGATHPGAKLATYSDIAYQLLSDLRWLPDGSGFLFSNVTLMRDSADIFRYDFSSKRVTQLTHLENEFARAFSISPDGQRVVFERAKSYDEDAPTDLWVMRIDGADLRPLVRNGQSPSW